MNPVFMHHYLLYFVRSFHVIGVNKDAYIRLSFDSPCNHGEREEYRIEEEEPKTAFPSVGMAVKAHRPVVAF